MFRDIFLRRIYWTCPGNIQYPIQYSSGKKRNKNYVNKVNLSFCAALSRTYCIEIIFFLLCTYLYKCLHETLCAIINVRFYNQSYDFNFKSTMSSIPPLFNRTFNELIQKIPAAFHKVVIPFIPHHLERKKNIQ